MKRVIASLLFFVTSVSHGAQPSQSASPDLNATLQRLARERILEFDRGDRSRWSTYVADGYVIATPSGAVRTKSDVMASFEPPKPGYHDVFSFENVEVRRDGDTAVMSYVIDEYEFWDNHKYIVPKLRKTDTYILRSGRWLLLASQETFVPAPYKAIASTPRLYQDYVGHYRLMRSLEFTVSLRKGTLWLREDGKSIEKALRPMSPTTFFSDGESAQYIFVRSADGRIDHFLIRDNQYDIKVPRAK